MPFVSSLNSTDEETMILSDNDSNNESMDNEVKPVKKPSKQSKNKKEVKSNKKKTTIRKNISYLDNIESLLKNEKIETDIINTITVKQGDNLINVKSPTNDKISEYWTMSHYKVKNIKNVDSKNRWKEAECSLKVTITDEEKDQELKNNLSEVVQTIFTRFMSDPKRKIIRSKLSKN
ncbi:unnamed protein product [Macrosiphum euphorbiae]|uniref:Uncharacterized protein n=1 Tax=Macrosiphum euphorbiae TaxID=13131 RepID=A0AAV0XTE9_9HEMI|nr:unnamed protein product [Macrosiphum euphorbiae]CAI6371692.1 unnamed protein product [Macrosiphum euphorbiae]CAI6371800.1 unnamed protein product [Macrosiphum euphorbiae]